MVLEAKLIRRTTAFACSVCFLFAAAACSRLNQPPRPENVPENAKVDKLGIWVHKDSEGNYKKYFSDGSVIKEGRFVKGKKEGLWRTYLPKNGSVTSEGIYRNDWRDGLWKFYDTRKEVYLTVEYRPEPKTNLIITTDYGNENGPYKRFYPDGSLEELGHYRAGRRHGSVEKYYRNGRLAFRGSYIKDRKDGKWEYFYPEGPLERIENYKNGKKDGSFINYYPDGSLYHETQYKNGEKTKSVIRRL